MPERMINTFREPDSLSVCIDAFERKLAKKRYFTKSNRQDDEVALRFLKELREIKNSPYMKTLRNDDLVLAQYDIIKIILGDKTTTVFNTEYGNRNDFIYTPEDCLQAAFKMVIPEKVDEEDLHFIVIASNARKGIVLEYGNHGPKFEQIGVTCGYA